jgi:hypothetical protein
MAKGVNKKLFKNAIISFILLSIIVIGVSYYFVYKDALIGPVFILLGLINLAFLKFYKIKIASVYPDMLFGFIDNGVLVIMAVLGGSIAGVAGAIIGGAAGNTITDGLGGLFEGHAAERLRGQKILEERTALSSTLGKMAGCLFGAGIGLILVWAISLVWAGI